MYSFVISYCSMAGSNAAMQKRSKFGQEIDARTVRKTVGETMVSPIMISPILH